MPRPEKVRAVEELRQRLQRATLAVSTSFSGMTVAEMNELRRRLRQAGLELKVVKNTLLRLAAEQAGRPQVMQVVAGPTAIAFAYGDPVEAARALDEYARSAPATFVVRGAVLDGSLLGPADLKELVALPPRPQLLAQVAGSLQSPLAALLGLLAAPLQELALTVQSLLGELPALIEARARQLEESQS
jgi:large subunit ribosomal protein L10